MGRLVDPKRNLYNLLHRSYNKAVQRAVTAAEEQFGKKLSQFSAEEIAALARQLLNSADSRVSGFLNQLGETVNGQSGRAALEGALADLETAIEEGITEFTPVFVIDPNGGYHRVKDPLRHSTRLMSLPATNTLGTIRLDRWRRDSSSSTSEKVRAP